MSLMIRFYMFNTNYTRRILSQQQKRSNLQQRQIAKYTFSDRYVASVIMMITNKLI